MMKAILATLLFLMPALAAGGDSESPPQCQADPEPATGVPAAAIATPSPTWAARFRRDADAVLAGEDFHQTNTSRHIVQREWLRRWLQNDHEARPASQLPFSPALIAEIVKWVLAGLLIMALVWLLWRGWQWLAPRAGQRRHQQAWQTQEAASLLLSTEELPASVGGAARQAWASGDGVLALSLLYRGAVQGLAAHYRIELPPSATEGECLRIARRSGQAVVTEGFAPIVRAWMALAYAQRAPDDFEQLARLFERHFAFRTETRP